MVMVVVSEVTTPRNPVNERDDDDDDDDDDDLTEAEGQAGEASPGPHPDSEKQERIGESQGRGGIYRRREEGQVVTSQVCVTMQ